MTSSWQGFKLKNLILIYLWDKKVSLECNNPYFDVLVEFIVSNKLESFLYTLLGINYLC